jgi:signal transduction histidine kinase
MNAIFVPIRWRLVAWTMAVLTIILLVLGTAVYFALERILLVQVDRVLASRAEDAEHNFAAIAGGESVDAAEGYRGGNFYVLLGASGEVLENPQRVSVASLDLPTLEPSASAYVTRSLRGEPVRLFVHPLDDDAYVDAVLVSGESLAPERRALHLLLAVLAAGAAGGALLSLGGAWFLAGRALRPIQEAFSRQQQFVADASHELRTPLTVLWSATDLLSQHRDEPLAANAALLDDLRHEISRLERLSGGLLTLARSDRGELELAVAEVDFEHIARDVVRRAAPLAEARGITLVCSGSEGPATVEADPDRVEQVLLILLDNALRHTPRGGNITLTVDQSDGAGMLVVEDTGDGIPEEHLTHVFDRFHRVDASRNRRGGGAGLGLAIAQALIAAHGGNISLARRAAGGTRVTILLPLLAPENELEESSQGSLTARR